MDKPESPPPAGTAPDDLLLFTPVAMTLTRVDGWTTERQRAFIDALSRMGVVAAAARSVGMSATSAYKLRERAGPGSSFVRAWDMAREVAGSMALDRAREIGRERLSAPIYHRGRQVGVRHYWDNRILLAALNALDRQESRELRLVHAAAERRRARDRK
ncbi:hypothetical protein [Sphingomonas lenta]|uniref:LysR family transcriptional regulator n=1 Tax=Sphingomonas lenta TaxID=1141887 RepID=A0A2A2SIT9_9SPHN|nr:hypothetical protein [Sphingomonas lenta]PAX09204.1 hypothetical protein CKY28_00045 [Sphingomonas lenta]